MRFTEEQRALRDTLRRITDERIKPIAAEIDDSDRFPTEWRDLMGQMGLLQMWVPESYGGPGGDLVSVCIAKEETARGSLAASTLVCNNSIGLILPVLHFGTDAQKEKYLRLSATDKVVAAVAMTEPQAGSDVAGMKTRAVRRPDGSWVMNGQKNWITWGEVADVVLVFAKSGDGPAHSNISAFIVDTKTPGFRVGRRERKMGRNGAPNNEL